MVRWCRKRFFWLLVFLVPSVLLLRYWVQLNTASSWRGVRKVEQEGATSAVAASEVYPGEDTEESSPESKNVAKVLLPDEECGQVKVSVLFLMRIAKCASTSLVQVVKDLSKKNKFLFNFDSSGASDWQTSEIAKVSSILQDQLSRAQQMGEFGMNELVVYARHMYYIDFPALPSLTYVTFVRDPLQRVASSYYYYHFNASPGIRRLVPPQRRGRGLGECVRLSHEGCTPNLLTKYFCGLEPFCASGGSRAVARAKENMRARFAVVGVLESPRASMALLARRMPQVFAGAAKLPQVNSAPSAHAISEEEHHLLRLMNGADLEVYQFATELLQEQLRACHLPAAMDAG